MSPKRWLYRLSISIVYLATLFGMMPFALAQQTPATPVPIIPSIEIHSVGYHDTGDYFEISLIYEAQHEIPQLNIKVENNQTKNLVTEYNIVTNTTVTLPADQLVRGQTYILTVTALQSNGTVKRIQIPGRNNEQSQLIQASRIFEYEQTGPLIVEFSKINYDAENAQYLLSLDISHAESVNSYTLWLQNDTALQISNDFVFRAPLPETLIIPIPDNLNAGKHTIMLEALDAQGNTLLRTQSDSLSYTPPTCNLTCMLSKSVPATITVFIVVIILAALLVYSLFRKQPKEYELMPQPLYTPAKELIDDHDITLYTQNKKIPANAPHMYLIAASGNAAHSSTTIETSPFSIGSAARNNMQLQASEISRKHALIHFKNGKYYLVDNKSSNGTRLNGHILKPYQEYPISDGDIIEFVKLKFKTKLK